MGWKKVSRKLHHDDRQDHKAALQAERDKSELIPSRDYLDYLQGGT
jgi:hypothetical protein